MDKLTTASKQMYFKYVTQM